MKKVVHGIITIMKRKFQLYSDGQQFHHNQQIKQPPESSHLKSNNHLSLQIKQPPLTSNHLTLKKDHNIWYWKFRSWLGTDTKLWQG